MTWETIDGGVTIGTQGSEGGAILRDEEHSLGARLTLERDTSIAPFAITCGIYGWMFHTRWFSSSQEATDEYEKMRAGLSDILAIIPYKTDPEADVKCREVEKAIAAFVSQFP
jgi:hypothetical protein